jgi:hypothetical protein
MAVFDIVGTVSGTPRTYGDLTNDCTWCERVVRGRWSGLDGLSVPLREPVRVDFRFRVHPESRDYGGYPAPNGRDLDTMVLQDSTLGALTVHRSRRPSLKIIESPARCVLITASKSLVTSDAAAGVDIRIRPVGEDNGIGGSLPSPDLSVRVPRSAVRSVPGLFAAIEQAAEQANQAKQISFSSDARIGLTVQFAVAGGRKNIYSASYLEAAVDALGNSRVGSRRLFQQDSFSSGRGIRNTDDSIVFSLVCVNHQDADDRPFVEIRVHCSSGALGGACGAPVFATRV